MGHRRRNETINTIEATSAPFESKYDTLNPGRDQLRLLKLEYQPDISPAGKIIATLATFQRDICPPYRALSYVWGALAPHKDRAIEINGSSFMVRSNLHDFLTMAARKQYMCEDTYLWIDQICINQGDDVEKSYQVKYMAETYKAAEEVVVWLGRPRSESSKEIVSTLLELCSHDGDTMSKTDRRRFNRAWNHLGQLPYWRRLWVYQEFLLCENLVVYYGDRKITWTSLLLCSAQSGSVNNRIRDFIAQVFIRRKTFHMERLISLREEHLERLRFPVRRETLEAEDALFATDDQRTWYAVLEMTRGTRCHSPHDRVYALLGLVTPAYHLEPNYSYPLEEIYWALVDFDTEELDAEPEVAVGIAFTFRRHMGLKGRIGHADIRRHFVQRWECRFAVGHYQSRMSSNDSREDFSPDTRKARRKFHPWRCVIYGHLVSWAELLYQSRAPEMLLEPVVDPVKIRWFMRKKWANAIDA